MPSRHRAPSKRETAQMRNFQQYILAGMIANLHNMYYNNSRTDVTGDPTLRQIGLCVDCLSDLRVMLKEAHNDN